MGMIAIIGGIGSGKSSVLQHISDLGKRTCDCQCPPLSIRFALSILNNL